MRRALRKKQILSISVAQLHQPVDSIDVEKVGLTGSTATMWWNSLCRRVQAFINSIKSDGRQDRQAVVCCAELCMCISTGSPIQKSRSHSFENIAALFSIVSRPTSVFRPGHAL